MSDLLIALGAYAAFLALLLFGYWVYGALADRAHARRVGAAFEAFVRDLDLGVDVEIERQS